MMIPRLARSGDLQLTLPPRPPESVLAPRGVSPQTPKTHACDAVPDPWDGVPSLYHAVSDPWDGLPDL